MNTIETIKLDRIPKGKMPVLHASQYDNGRTHGIDLTNLGEEWKLDGTETLTIKERKVDNNICSMDIENTFVGSSHIVFASFLQMCACAGSNFCELRISKGGVDIGTLNFILEVEPDPTADGIESESEIRNLETQIREITEEVIGDDYYTADQTDEAIATAIEGKADKTYVDTELAKKADKTDTYTKTQVDNALNNKMNKANPTGTGSLAVGTGVVANGTTSQAFGYNTTASGTASTALGNTTTASGNQSTSEGNRTVASGDSAHASGRYTISNHRSQYVFGEWNKEDNSSASATVRGNYVEIVGNGTSENNRSNGRTLDWQGNETLAGDLIINGNQSVSGEITRLDGRIDNLPTPMIFKGTLGVGGTIQTLPTASASNEGYTYKVITDGTYAGQTAKVGDVFTSNGSAWVLIPAGDEDTDTWRNIKVNGVEKLGNGISSGSLDVVDTDNIEAEFDANGNKLKLKTKNIYTQSEVDTLIANAVDSVLPTDSVAKSAVANFETDLAKPIELKAYIEATQASGIPTPSTPLPISGWSEVEVTRCGANLWDEQWQVGGYDTSDGQFNPSLTGRICSKNYIPVNPNTSVYFLGLSGSTVGNVFYYDKDKNYLSFETGKGNSVCVTPNDCYFMNFNAPTAYGTEYHNDLGILYPSSEHNYHAYTKQEVIIPLGDTYYGGYVTQDKDGHRQLVVTHKRLALSTLTDWSRITNYTNPFFRATLPEDCKVRTANNKPQIAICDSYAWYSSNQNYWQYIGNYEFVTAGFGVSSVNRVYIRNDDYSTKDDFAASLSGVYIIYELAEPIVIDLPDGEPLNAIIGTNNLFADSGDMECSFKCGVAMYVDNHSGGGGNLLGMGGVYLGGAKSGGGEEDTDEGEDTEKVKLDDSKEEVKTIGDTKKLGGE